MLYLISVIISMFLYLITLLDNPCLFKKTDEYDKYNLYAFGITFVVLLMICFIPFINLIIYIYFIYDLIKCRIQNKKFYRSLRKN